MLKTLHRNVQRLQSLVEQVLKESDHIRTETGVKLERREFDLWPLVEALIYDLRPVAGTASTQLINEVPEDLTVYADASLLKRVFQNLIANAIKYTPRGEVVIVAHQHLNLPSVPISLETLSSNSLMSRAKEVFNVSRLVIIIEARESITYQG
jgi:signal transduction histidine kinase